jgi:hypothetical protein
MTAIAIRPGSRADFTGPLASAARILRRVRAMPRLLRLRYHVRMADIAFAQASGRRPETEAERWARRYVRGRF